DFVFGLIVTTYQSPSLLLRQSPSPSVPMSALSSSSQLSPMNPHKWSSQAQFLAPGRATATHFSPSTTPDATAIIT
ncbi:unnamed protein product, partial [Mycena citricolor]